MTQDDNGPDMVAGGLTGPSIAAQAQGQTLKKGFRAVMTQPDQQDALTGHGRALVCVGLEQPPVSGVSRNRSAAPVMAAAFIVQLLACRDGLAPYRARRRAEPQRAAFAYRAAQNLRG